MSGAIWDSLLSLFYPQPCHVCSADVEKRTDGTACSRCWESTRLFDYPAMRCEKCGALLGEQPAIGPVFCLRCDEHHYVAARALGVYEKALVATVIDLKHRPHLPHRIRQLIAKFIESSDLINADVLIPVPLSVQRHKERGFNQAEVIADAISRSSGIPDDAHSLRRSLHTPLHRIGMDQKARELTVTKAFAVVRPNLIEGKRVVLVDDVLTSGSTASACSKVLLRAGATRVDVFTLARAAFR